MIQRGRAPSAALACWRMMAARPATAVTSQGWARSPWQM